MIRPFALSLALLWPALAQAQTVPVVSGEHEGFSRLLLQQGVGPGWSFGKVEGGYEFRAQSADVEYDLSAIYERIPRTRIAEITDLGDGHLFLAVACACHADAFPYNNGDVVLDIIDGPAPTPDWPSEAWLDPVEQVVEDTPEDVGTEQPQAIEAPDTTSEAPPSEAPPPVSDRGGLPLMTAERETPYAGSAGLPFGPLRNFVPSEAESGSAASGSTPAQNERVADTQTALLEQIARAAAQGLLDADMGRIEAGVAQATDTEPETVMTNGPRVAPPITPDGHISVETSIDRAAAEHSGRIGKTDDGTACLNPALFDVASWGTPIPNGTDLGAHRSQVVGEFDDPRAEGLTDLARYYVYLSFGTEAQAMIKRYADEISHAALLYVMADIMDNGASSAAASLAEQMACEGTTALWATLAQPKLTPSLSINRPAVTLAFSGLPPHLRRHLGPGLAEKLLAAGDTETADIIRNSYGRVAEKTDSSLDLLSARFDLAEGNVDSAISRLDDVVATGDDNLPEALLARVEATLAESAAVPEETITLLESLAFERRDTEIGRRLIDADIRARASASDFQTAFDQLGSAIQSGDITEKRADQLRRLLFVQLATNSADAGFLRLVVGYMDEVIQLPTEDRRPVASRLLDLRLPHPARQVLDGLGDAVPEEADRLLYARAAILEERPDVAIGYLAGLHGEVADPLRADALAHAGDHAGAVRSYEGLGNIDAALRNAWEGGLWPDVAMLNDGSKGAAAQLMQNIDPATPADMASPEALPTTPLAKSQALIVKSQAVRDTLDALLTDIEPLSAP